MRNSVYTVFIPIFFFSINLCLEYQFYSAGDVLLRYAKRPADDHVELVQNMNDPARPTLQNKLRRLANVKVKVSPQTSEVYSAKHL